MKTVKSYRIVICCIVFLFFISAQFALAQNESTGSILFNKKSKRTLALVVGISDYEHINDLSFAHKDAEDFAAFLKSPEGLNLPPENIKLYTNKEATLQDVLYNGFAWLGDELNEGDEAFIFYSGHGDIRNQELSPVLRTGFLLTHNSIPDRYEATAIRMKDFLTQFHMLAQKNKATIRVIMDVCHSGVGSEPGGIISLLELAGEFNKEKQIVITSCKYDQYSWEYPELQNGAFSYFFLQGMKGAADYDGNLQISLNELQRYSEENVNRYVKSRNNTTQFPEFKGSYSHRVNWLENTYEGSEIPLGYGNNESEKKGVKKGVIRNPDPEIEKIIDELEEKDLNNYELRAAYNQYMEQSEATEADKEQKRKLKRELVAAMTEKANKSLISYFDQSRTMRTPLYYEIASENFLNAAKLLGEDHLLYEELISKYFFMDALRLKALGDQDKSKVVTQLTSALTLAPNASYTLNELGNMYYDKGDYKTALGYYEKANQISPAFGKNVIKTNKRLGKTNATNQQLQTAKAYGAKSAKASGDNVFHIQLAAAGDVNRDAFEKVENLGPITPTFNSKTNTMNTLMGPFETREEAASTLKKVRQRGLKDAFLVETPRDTSFDKKLNDAKVQLRKEKAAVMPYQVRIAAVKTFNKKDYASLNKIGEVDTEPVNGKTLTRVVIRANSKGEANAILQKVKKAGYPNAYVFEKLKPILKPGDAEILPSSYESRSLEESNYKIRVATVSKLVEGQFKNLESFGNVYKEVLSDRGLIRISIGYYKTKQEAMQVLNRVKKQGYKDAFLEDLKD